MEKLEQYHQALANKAFNLKFSQGRSGVNCSKNYFWDDDHFFLKITDPFTVDAVKILNSKAFRRLATKTQVFPTPNNPHIRTRQEHVLEVWALALPIAKFLGLNVSLCQAIALGHDLGHAPFGHFGEEYITKNSGRLFNHAANGVVVCQQIERKGAGLNLMPETLRGILLHSRTRDKKIALFESVPEEFNLVMLADKIAYTFADYNDAKRMSYIKEPNSSNIAAFGAYQRMRISTCAEALICESAEKGRISFDSCTEAKEFKILRNWLYQNVYHKINYSLQKSYFDRLIDFFQKESFFAGCDPYLLLSLLTDLEIFHFAAYCNTAQILKLEHFSNFGIMEIVPWIKDKKIDFSQFSLG